MSLFNPVQAVCPKCGALDETPMVASVNADRRPDLRRKILDRTFQALRCQVCGTDYRMPPTFTFMHLGARQWIVAEPASLREEWVEAEERTKEVFAEGYGAEAPPAAQRLGAELKVRLVFGWPALREKLVAHDLGIEDVTLELVKIAILSSVPKSPVAEGQELRLESGDDTTLRFRWQDMHSEEGTAVLSVPRSICDDVGGSADWAALRTEVSAGPFVDMDRVLLAD